MAREILKRFSGHGSTCHHGMDLKVYDVDELRANVENKRAMLDRLRRSFVGCKVLVVDEVSMVGRGMLGEIDSDLREITHCYEATFGGWCILLMGDFVQLEYVAQLPLYGGVKCQQGGQDLVDQEGRELFGLFLEVCLTKQHRATDPEHARVVTAFCQWTPKSMDVRKKFFSRLKEVTQRDFADKDEGWEEAAFVSTDQKTVHAVNQVMVQQYAKRTGVPMVAWRLPMADKYEGHFGE